jgi:hypothetical protein
MVPCMVRYCPQLLPPSFLILINLIPERLFCGRFDSFEFAPLNSLQLIVAITFCSFNVLVLYSNLFCCSVFIRVFTSYETYWDGFTMLYVAPNDYELGNAGSLET